LLSCAGVPVDFEEVDLNRANYDIDVCNDAITSIRRNTVALKGEN